MPVRFSKFLVAALALGSAAAAENIGPLELLPSATVSSRGVFLSDLATNRLGGVLPPVQLGAAPPVGRPVFVSRAQVNDLLNRKAPELVCTNWSGADRVKIVRATRVVTDVVIRELLTGALQREAVKDLGELELRLTRPWANVLAPDEPLSVKIVELPTSGVSPNFICRFDLFARDELVGTYQQPLQAKVWREIYVAHSSVLRGQLLREADLALERRDILNNRDYLTALPLDNPYIEFRDNVPAGAQITQRALRLRAIVRRGRQVDAMFRDDSLTIAVRAEALEDGVPGQIVRVRNLQSKREFKGKVQDEQTVVVLF